MSYVALDIFQQLRQEDIHWMLATSELKTIPANGVLVREDDPSQTIFFIADGLFEVYVYGGSAQRLKVGQLGPGEIIGEISWLDGRPVSATVRALETSSVIALSIATLERKLAEDAAFAARLYRAVATLMAERLRTTTSQVRAGELAGGRQPAGGSSAEATDILAKVAELKKALAATDAAQVAQALAGVERGMAAEGMRNAGKLTETLGSELLPVIRLSATAERLYAKPRGYACDYQTIEAIYADKPAGEGPAGALLDRAVLDLAALKAIRSRRQLLAAEIVKSYAATQKELYVASLACGPGSEIFDAFANVADKGRLQVSCIDGDREALAHVAARAQAEKLGDRLQTFHGNLIYFATGRQEMDLPSQDLVYSLNLTDYFSDEQAVKLIDWIHGELRPGGRAILGNFHPRNPTRGLMEHVLDWRVTHRDEAAMNQLFQASRFAKPSARITLDDQGAYLLAECVK